MPPERSIHTATNKELAFLILLQSYQHGVLPLWFDLIRPVNKYFLVHLLTSHYTIWVLGTDVWCDKHRLLFSFWVSPAIKYGMLSLTSLKGKELTFIDHVLHMLALRSALLLIIYLPDTYFVPDPVLCNAQQSLLSQTPHSSGEGQTHKITHVSECVAG